SPHPTTSIDPRRCLPFRHRTHQCRRSFFFQAEDGIRHDLVTGVQTCALPIYAKEAGWPDEAREFVEQFLTYCGFVPEGAEDADEAADEDGEDEGEGEGEGEDEGEGES